MINNFQINNIRIEGRGVIFTDEIGREHKIKFRTNKQGFALIQYRGRCIFFKDLESSIVPYVRDGDKVRSLYGNECFELSSVSRDMFVRG